MNLENVGDVIKFLQATYPRQAFSADNVKAYVMMLEDLPIDHLRMAVLKLAADSKWFPSIAEIRGAAADLDLQSRGIVSAIEAYEIAQRHNIMRIKDEYPDVHAAARMSCYTITDMRKSQNVAADRARFIEAYNEILSQRRQEITNTPPVRAFLSSGANDTPRLIGDGYAID